MSAPAPHRAIVLTFVLLSIAVIAVEATVISTAMPQIAGQLGDLHLYSWVFSTYLLAQTALTVVFGKLADLFGRKPVLITGLVIFLTGSLLCGFAWSMPSLIVFRVVQGVGAGGIQPVALTVVGDLYPGRERAKVQGYLASIWAIASVLGPLVGGFIVAHVHWAWVFWINLPIGLAAIAGFALVMREHVAAKIRQIDVAGAILFALTVALVMAAITQAGSSDPIGAAMAAMAAAISAAAFAWQEHRAPDPMMDFRLWSRRPIATTNAATVLSGMTTVGLTAFLPMYVQAVMGRSPQTAGLALSMLVLGWPIGATTATRLFPRFGMRRTMLFGAMLMPLGGIAFIVMHAGSSPVQAGIGSLVTGLGMGAISTSAIVLIQECVGWEERGVVTASNIFSRNLGSTLGATVLGGVVNWSLSRQGGVDLDQVRRLLDHPGATAVDPAVTAGLGAALHLSFWAVLIIALACLAIATQVPNVTFKPAAAPSPPHPKRT